MNPSDCLTEAEIHTLIQYLCHHGGPTGIYCSPARNALIAALMADAGLRVGELIQLTPAELLSALGSARLLVLPAPITKIRKTRAIPLTMRLSALLQKYVNKAQPLITDPATVYGFPSRDSDHHITSRQVRRIINIAGIDALKRHVHPHMLRHSFATRLIPTTNIRIIQELLGHKNLNSTQVYTHPTPDDLRTAIDGLSQPALQL